MTFDWIEECTAGFVPSDFEPQPVTVKPPPEIPPPVWDTRPLRGEDCMAATRALCG